MSQEPGWVCPRCGGANTGSICTDCGENRPEKFEPYYLPHNPNYPSYVLSSMLNNRLGHKVLNGAFWGLIVGGLILVAQWLFWR
jgi:hypothetical protein